MEMIDTRIYDDIFLLSKIFKCTELNKDEKERLYKHFEKRKKGEWIFSPSRMEGICTNCNCKIYGRPYQNTYLIVPYKYCPNCGAYMGGEDNG